jgi:leucyl aminopeptidase
MRDAGRALDWRTMKIALSTNAPLVTEADLLALGIKSDRLQKDPTLKAIDQALGGALQRLIADDNFKGTLGETLTVALPHGLRATRFVLIGLGSGNVTTRDARAFGAKAAHLACRLGTLAVVAPAVGDEHLRALAEGLGTGSYKYTRYLTGDRKPKRQLGEITVLLPAKASKAAGAAIDDGLAVADAMNLARDLVNAPPNDLHPIALAAAAKAEAHKLGLECVVLDEKAMEKRGMHLLLAVARGSANKPRFVHLTYKPKKAKKGQKKIVFVGKGLTFDSGGLCLKPGKSMIEMKCDMGGAAVTLAIVLAAAKLQLPVEVHGILACVENMPDGDAYRPGDVFPSLDGKTVEIINTDAEGRLVLADALTYARELAPDYLLDHATLTGAAMVALGPFTAALFANDEGLAKKFTAAAADTGESYWRMPLTDELREALKSDIADIKHMGDAHGGSITAALFLREFVGKTKWAHLDIAGPTFADRARSIYPKGGTGFGVLTGVRLLEQLG